MEKCLKLYRQSVVAGCFVTITTFISIYARYLIGGDLGLILSYILFPIGFVFIEFTNSKLFTNCLYNLEVKLKEIFVIYLGNLIGCVFSIFFFLPIEFSMNGLIKYIGRVSTMQFSHTRIFFLEAIICEFCVLLGVYFAKNQFKDTLFGRIFVIWLTTFMFNFLGLSHCVVILLYHIVNISITRQYILNGIFAIIFSICGCIVGSIIFQNFLEVEEDGQD